MRLGKGRRLLSCVGMIILLKLCRDMNCQLHPGYSIDVNTRIAVQERSCVTIPCSFTAGDKNSFTGSIGYWKKFKSVVVAATSNVFSKGTKPNFHITGDPDRGQCTLTINDARKKDSGLYYFRFEGPTKYEYQAKSVSVTVIELPKKPEVVITSADGELIATNSTVVIEDGEHLTLNCSVQGDKSASVTWIKGEGQSSVWTAITLTPSEADTYRCLAWDEHGLSERHLHIAQHEKNAEGKAIYGKENSNRIFDLLMGIVCGIIIVISSLLASKLIARRYFNTDILLFVHTENGPARTTKEPPVEDTMEDNPDKLYMNVNEPALVTKISRDALRQRDSNSSQDDEETHYSTIDFKSHTCGVSSNQPETEYAEISLEG